VSKLGHALNEATFLNAKGAEAFAKEGLSLRSFANNFASFALELFLKIVPSLVLTQTLLRLGSTATSKPEPASVSGLSAACVSVKRAEARYFMPRELTSSKSAGLVTLRESRVNGSN
jgi:hypothetical protein